MNGLRKSLFVFSQRLNRRFKQLIIWLIDLCITPLCFLLSVCFTYHSPWPTEQISRLIPAFALLTVIAGCASLLCGLPRIKLKTYQTFGTDGILPFAATLGAAAFLITRFPGLDFPLVGILAFVLILFLTAIGLRMLLLQIYTSALRYGKTTEKALIYGAGSTGLRLASALKAHERLKLVAFIDDDPGLQGQRLAGLRIHPTAHIAALIRQHEISRMIIAMPSLSAPKQMRILREMEHFGISVQVVPDFDQLAGKELQIDRLKSVSAASFLNRDRVDTVLPVGSEAYEGCSVMVSGAGGSIGSELCRQLLACRPRRLVLFEISEVALYNIERELKPSAAEHGVELVAMLGSVTDARAVSQAIAGQKVEIVLHAAAYKHVPLVEANPIVGLINNVFGTRTLADACARAGVSRFLLVSTDKAVRPTNVMGASKRMAELVIQDMAHRHHGTRFSIVRFGNVLGSSGSVIPLFQQQIARGGPITLTHAEVTRYFMTISEAARLVLAAGAFHDLSHRGRADVFVLDMGEPVRIYDLAEQLVKAAGYTLRDAKNPGGDIEIRIIGLRPGEKLHEELLIGGGLLRTPHPKIMRATEEDTNANDISAVLQRLTQIAAAGEGNAARELALQVAFGHALKQTDQPGQHVRVAGELT